MCRMRQVVEQSRDYFNIQYFFYIMTISDDMTLYMVHSCTRTWFENEQNLINPFWLSIDYWQKLITRVLTKQKSKFLENGDEIILNLWIVNCDRWKNWFRWGRISAAEISISEILTLISWRRFNRESRSGTDPSKPVTIPITDPS